MQSLVLRSSATHPGCPLLQAHCHTLAWSLETSGAGGPCRVISEELPPKPVPHTQVGVQWFPTQESLWQML